MIEKLYLIFAITVVMTIGEGHVYAQEKTYPARVVTGPNFAQDLFYSNATQQMIKSKVPHLQSLDVEFGLANWYWTTNPSVAAATTAIYVELNIDYVGFVMNMPNGGSRRVTFAEANISPPSGYAIHDIELDIEFGKIGTRATVSTAVQGARYGELSKNSWGHIKFNSNQDEDKFNKFIKDNKLRTVKDIFAALDPQVSITNLGKWIESSFVLGKINTYIQKVWAEGSVKIKLDNLLADARNAETFGRTEEALQKYEEAYAIDEDPAIKTKIDELKNKTKEQETYQVSNTQNKATQQEEENKGLNSTPSNSTKQTNAQEAKTTTAQSNNGEQVELDFWGNPVKKPANTTANTNTASYGGMEVQDNEHYRAQMALRERNANAERTREVERLVERRRVDDHNNTVYNQAQQGIAQTNRDIAELDNSIKQLDVSSGKNLLESSGNLARAATATGNVGQAKGALIGMGVGTVMAIGEGAAKRKAAREAREERERLEKERTAKVKAALRNARTSVLNYFEPGELPMSSTTSRENNLYYFVYALDRSRIEENSCQVYTSNVFAVGRYPDGTWPMKTKVEHELNALSPLEETIHGPYQTLHEAQNSRQQFLQYAEKARMEVVAVEHKGFNVQSVGSSRTSTGPTLDFFGNPINPKTAPTGKEAKKKEPVKTNNTTPKLDFFGNPIKE